MKTALKLWEWLKGKKTYILTVALWAYALGGFVTGHLTWEQLVTLLFGGGFAATLRHAKDNK